MNDNQVGGRIFYIRDRSNILLKEDNTYTRGDPVALVLTDVDRERNIIRYSLVAMRMPMHKKLAKFIAEERLHGVDARDRDKSMRNPKRTSKRTHPAAVSLSVLVPNTRHEIMKLVMLDIFKTDSLPRHINVLAGDWLAFAKLPKARTTIPSPPPPEEFEDISIPMLPELMEYEVVAKKLRFAP